MDDNEILFFCPKKASAERENYCETCCYDGMLYLTLKIIYRGSAEALRTFFSVLFWCAMERESNYDKI